MTLDGLIASLQALRAIHGGELPVAFMNVEGGFLKFPDVEIMELFETSCGFDYSYWDHEDYPKVEVPVVVFW